MLTVGFTTGFLYDSSLSLEHQNQNISKGVIEKCLKFGANAIELNCIGGFYDSSLCDLSHIDPIDLKKFKHVSIHAPCRNALFANDKKTQEVLKILKREARRLNADLIVFHPDTINDWKIFKNFEVPVAIENMDNRKKSFKAVEDLKKVFEFMPWCKFVLDLNHCMTNDPSMKLAYDFINAFADKIEEIHISGYSGYHYPLHKTGQLKILDAVYDSSIPMIIESCCDSLEDAQMEIWYIKEYFDKRRC